MDARSSLAALYAVAFSVMCSAAGVVAVMQAFTFVWKSLHEPIVIRLMPKVLI